MEHKLFVKNLSKNYFYIQNNLEFFCIQSKKNTLTVKKVKYPNPTYEEIPIKLLLELRLLNKNFFSDFKNITYSKQSHKNHFVLAYDRKTQTFITYELKKSSLDCKSCLFIKENSVENMLTRPTKNTIELPTDLFIQINLLNADFLYKKIYYRAREVDLSNFLKRKNL